MSELHTEPEDLSRQEEQQQMVDDAVELPGVADLVELYERVGPFADTVATPREYEIVYATGGNQ